MGITSDLGIDRSGPRTQRLSGNAAAWIFGCYLHFHPYLLQPTRAPQYEGPLLLVHGRYVQKDVPTARIRRPGPPNRLWGVRPMTPPFAIFEGCEARSPSHVRASFSSGLNGCAPFHPWRQTRYTGILMANPIQPN